MIGPRHLPQALTAAALAGALAFGAGLGTARAQEALERLRPPPSDHSEAVQKERLLDSLFARLQGAPSPEGAKVLERAVWNLWLQSGSPTVDLLMRQVDKAVEGTRYDAALAILDAVVDIAPDYTEGWNKRATINFLLNNFDESLQDLERVLALEPRHFGALAGRGLILRETGDREGALRAFRRALEIHPFLPAARDAVRTMSPEVEGQPI